MKEEIRTILLYLMLEDIAFPYCYKPTAELAFCLVLWRLAAPNRLKENMYFFGRSRSWQSTIINEVIVHLVQRFSKKLHWDENRLTRECIQGYSNAIEETGGVKGVWGWIDGTLRPVCRPVEDQRHWYSGYKKKHCF